MPARRSTTPSYVDGLAIYRRPVAVEQLDDRPPVLLVHGSMDRAAAFRKAVRHLPDLDVTLYDRRGYGRSSREPIAATMDDLVADLESVAGGQRFVLVGHSLGGVIALALAQRSPEHVAAVGAFEAPMAWQRWWPSGSAGGVARHTAATKGPEEAAEQFMRRIVGDERWDRLPDSTRRQRRSEGAALLADLGAMQGDAPPYETDRIAVPVVAGFGTQSDARHQRAASELASGATTGALITIEGAPHGAHYSHPAEFADFVRQVVDAAPPLGSVHE